MAATRDPHDVLTALARRAGVELPPDAASLLAAPDDGSVDPTTRALLLRAVAAATSMPGLTDAEQVSVDTIVAIARARGGLAASLLSELGVAALPPDWPAQDGPEQHGPGQEVLPQEAVPPVPPQALPSLDGPGQHEPALSTAAGLQPPALPERPDAPPAGPDDSRRRWPWVLAGLAVAAAVAAPSYLAWANFETGERWKARSATAEGDVARLDAENSQLEQDLEELRSALASSERDVERLEGRVAQLANEKARVEDEREAANAAAERISEVAAAYDDVAGWFQSCREEQAILTDMVFDFEDYFYAGQTYLISGQISRVGDVCATAERRLAELRGYLDLLGG